MDPTTISLARLLELDVPRSWQEVVAVAMCAGDVMKHAGTALTADLCVISVTGELAYAGKALHRAGAGDALASLLASLLEDQSAPPELRALAASPREPSGADGLDVLMTALAYYERPNRQADVAALAERALAADAQAHGDAELQRLRSGRSAKTAAPSAPPDRHIQRLLSVAAAAATLTVMLLAGAVWYLERPAALAPPEAAATPGSTPPQSTVTSLVSAASEAAASVADAGLRAIGLAADESEPATAPPGSAPKPPAPAVRRPRDLPPGASDASAAAEMPTPAAPAAVAAPVPELPVVAADPADAVSAGLPSGTFTADDRGVEPPLLVYPQLPTEARPVQPGSSEAHFEILVDERGEVEQVRLRAPEARLDDRMMVSAVKAWRFKPASKDGRPVRYRVLLPITK